ncbi:MAG: DUF1684 domain-containing protein [Deltaproteobacteria bacterium]
MTRFLLLLWMVLAVQPTQPDYKTQILQWRERRVKSLTSDTGWLTVAGLFWLKEGKNTVGAAPGNTIVLPKGSATDSLGTFEFHNGVTTFEAAPGADVIVDGRSAKSAVLRPDMSGNPDLVQSRALTMFVIQRGNRFGIRLKDRNAGARKEFAGIKYFPIDESYRVKAKFAPFHPPRKIAVPNILGDTSEEPSPGYVEFTLHGKPCRLTPVQEDDQLFFIFKDLTSGKETYPPGRFLYTDMPQNGEVILDFNKAYNPPCAFTAYATCPLPPAENHLSVRLEAGEVRYGH